LLVALPPGSAAPGGGRNPGAGGFARTEGFANPNVADVESRMSYLYAAYIATWAIHVAYLGTLLRRYIRLRNEIAEFNTREERQ
jgi:hypothetical protein